jgi:hypothetical protein
MANLLTAAAVYPFWEMHPSDPPSFTGKILTLLLGWSLFLGVANLIPRSRGIGTDGWKLLSFSSSFRKGRRALAVTALDIASTKQIRPELWNKKWLRWAISLDDWNVLALRGHWMAYLNAFSLEERDNAAKYLEECLRRFEVATPMFRELMIMECSVFKAWFDRDAVRAERWAKVSSGKIKFAEITVLRQKIAVDCARLRFDEAIAYWEKGLETIKALNGPAGFMEGWLKWRPDIEERQREYLDSLRTT